MALRRGLINCGCLLAMLAMALGFGPARSIAGDSTGTGGSSAAPTASVARVSGVIVAIDQASVTFRTSSTSRTVPLSSQVLVLLLDGSLGTVAQVQSGEYALLYIHGAYGATPQVTAIVLLGVAPPAVSSAAATPTPSGTPSGTVTACNGTIIALDQTSLTLSTSAVTQTYALASQVSVRINGQAGTLSQIVPPQQARVYLRIVGSYPVIIGVIVGGEASAVPTATPTTSATKPTYSALNGTIIALDQTSLTLSTSSGTQTYALASQVSVRINGQTGTLAQITPPQEARVYLRAVAGADPTVVGVIVGGEATASPTAVPATPGVSPVYNVLTGTITALNSTSLTLANSDGSRTLVLAAQVSVRLANGQRGTVASVTVGEVVEVYLRSSSGSNPLVVGIVVQQATQ